MEMPDRCLHRCNFQIDTNRINSRQADPDMNQLEAWHANKVIYIDMSLTAYNEARQGRSAKRTDKTMGYVFTFGDYTAVEGDMRSKISAVLFPHGPESTNESNDVEIVLQAWKNHRILVTNDGGSKTQPGGILGNR